MSDKAHTKVSFETVLPVAPDLPPYRLSGVIEHHGKRAGGGHYASFVRPPDNFWYHCDDEARPQRVSTETVLAAQAYVLVYEAV